MATEQDEKTAAEHLSAATGRPVAAFTAENYEVPSLDELETVPPEELDD